VQYNDTLQSMIGVIRNVKPNIPAPLAKQFLNLRMRQVLDSKTNWAASIKFQPIYIPNAVITGGITLNPNSATVSGTGTGWPVNDVINGTIPAGITTTGLQWVTPDATSAKLITDDTILYVDAAGTPEIVPVTQVRPGGQFRAVFQYPHNANCTITCSSLSQRQLVPGMTYPIYTVLAVVDAQTLILDAPWAGDQLVNSAYQILKIYYTLATDIKDIMYIVDPVQPIELGIHIPQAYLSARDPRRQTMGSAPEMFLDRAPNLCGNMQYELYPPQTASRQLNMLYFRQWPDMEAPGDRPPSFINPGVLIAGACADAKWHKVDANDAYFDQAAGDRFDKIFLIGLGDAMNADNAKAQQQLEWNYRQLFGMGGYASSGSYAQSHDIGSWDSWNGGY
jgi:hypothetical protein